MHQGEFPARCNMGMIALEKVDSPEDMDELRGFIQAHQDHTGSVTAKKLLDDFGTSVTKFVKVRAVRLSVCLASVRLCRLAGWLAGPLAGWLSFCLVPSRSVFFVLFYFCTYIYQ